MLAPPVRVHGDRLTDHMAAMLRAERAHAAALADGRRLLAAGRAAAGMASRVQDAVLALLRSADPADCVTGEMPGILAVDAARNCAWRRMPARHAAALPDGHGGAAAGRPGGAVPGATATTMRRLLHGEAAGLARHDALVQVPGRGAAGCWSLVRRDAERRSIRRRGRARWRFLAAPWLRRSDAMTRE